MIKCNKGSMEFSGSKIQLRAEMTCLVNAFINDDDLCDGKTKEERVEWFNKHIIEKAADQKERNEKLVESVDVIAKLLGKSANDILKSIAELLINADEEEEEND